MKDVSDWPAGKINRALDALDRRASKNTDAFIAAGRGRERPSEYLEKDDPLSREALAIFRERSALQNEIERRYGPGAPRRLPARGFGPIGKGRHHR